jgi:hypothetical protein
VKGSLKKSPTLIHPPSKCGRCVQHSFLKSLGFTKSKIDSKLYFMVMNDDPVILFLLYVDDVFLTR